MVLRHRFEHIYRRIAAPFGDAALHDNVPVENAADRIGDRLIVIVPFHEHREQSP